MPPEATETQPAAPVKSKGKRVPIMIVAGVMLLEGVGVFVLAKLIGSAPVTVAAAEVEGEEKAPEDANADAYAEVELVECRPSNMMSGRFITFQVRVSCLVDHKDQERAQKMAGAKRARIEDGVNTVFRSAEPKHLAEPELETLKRRLKHEIDQIFGEDQLVKRILIPQLLQSRPGV